MEDFQKRILDELPPSERAKYMPMLDTVDEIFGNLRVGDDFGAVLTGLPPKNKKSGVNVTKVGKTRNGQGAVDGRSFNDIFDTADLDKFYEKELGAPAKPKKAHFEIGDRVKIKCEGRSGTIRALDKGQEIATIQVDKTSLKYRFEDIEIVDER